MPYKDPEKRRAYLADYEVSYRQENAARIAARKAAWFQKNKGRLQALWAQRDREKRARAAAAAAAQTLQVLSEHLNPESNE